MLTKSMKMNWQDLCIEGIFIPGHQSSSFNIQPCMSLLLATFVNAWNLQQECLCSLLVALEPSHPDQNIWLDSFCKEKSGIQLLNIYVEIGLAQYRALLAQGAPRAIPSMYVLTIKKDEMLNPLCAKSQIIALGNHEDSIWTKSEKYTPIL
jgi:hypothetical protein